MKENKYIWILMAVSVAFLSACSSTPELRKREGFLSTYNLLKVEDDATFRHSNPVLLALSTEEVIWTWGDNFAGQLGDGTWDDRESLLCRIGVGPRKALALQ